MYKAVLKKTGQIIAAKKMNVGSIISAKKEASLKAAHIVNFIPFDPCSAILNEILKAQEYCTIIWGSKGS